MTDRTVELINAAYRIAEAAQPITVRGVAYKLFVQGLIPSMSKEDVRAGAYRPLLKAREAGIIPWDWIVDETRSLEKTATWDEPEELAEELATGYRKEFWNQQPVRCEVWSEKGTVRGLLQPVLEKYGVGFRVMHGYSSATVVYEVSQRAKREGKELAALYVGDRDPSGLDMSERDLPKRIAKYSKYETFPVLVTGMESFEELADIALRPDTESYVTLKRVALTQEQTPGLVSFSVEEKKGDTRYKWFKANHGDRCWELDAMDPNDLRDCVEREIKALIEPVAWKRCEVVNEAERTNLETTLKAWSKDPTAQDSDFWITEWMQED